MRRTYTLEKSLHSGSCAIAVLTLLAPQTGFAQEAESVGVGEIVVTAQKREERLQDVPIAITALTSTDLDNKQILRIDDIKNVVPNLYLEQGLGSPTQTKIFLRGGGSVNPVFSFDSPIGFYFDDVYIARSLGALIDLYDVDRVEFLRGPQGTLFGRNNSVGALRVFNKLPSLDGIEGSASLAYGTRDQINANFAVSAPLIDDKLGLRVTFLSRTNDGFQTDQSGKRFMDNNINAFRAALLYKAGDNVDVIVRGDYMADHSNTGQGSNFRFDTDDDVFTFERTLDAPIINEVEPWGVSTTVNVSLPSLELKSVTAYREVRFRNANDVDGRAAVRSFEVQQQDLDEWQLSQEISLTGDQIGELPLKWTTGIFYLHENNKFVWALRIFAPPTTQFFDQDTDTLAAYAQVTLPLFARFEITGGLRYSYEKKSITATQNLADGTPNSAFQFDDSITANKVNWHASANYKVTDDVMFYANASTAFRSGGFNGSARDVPSILSGGFGPETVFAVEGGAKTQWLDDRLRLNVDYFYTEYDNLQQAITQTDGTITTRNVNATVKGVEAELTVVPVVGLEISGTLGTIDDNIQNSAEVLSNTPSLQWRLGAVWSFPLGARAGTLRVGGDVSHSASYFNGSNSVTAGLVEAYELYNAQVSYTTPDDRWQFSLSGYNLSDHVFNTHTFDIASGFISSVQFPSTPRLWLGTIGYKF